MLFLKKFDGYIPAVIYQFVATWRIFQALFFFENWQIFDKS